MTGPREGRLTVTQRQLWALDQRTRLPGALNLSYALEITGPLHLAALAGAFHDLVDRHETLRSTVRPVDGEPVVEVAGAALGLDGLALDPRTVPDRAAAALLAAHDRLRGFDLTREAPLRARLLRLAERHHVLLLTLHHIAADGWSLHVVNQVLSSGYAARVNGGPVPAQAGPAPPVTCAGQAEQQQAWLAGPAARQEAAWWTQRLGPPGGPGPRYPTGGPGPLRPADHDDTGTWMSRQVAVLPDALASRLRGLGRAAGVSLFAVLLTAVQALLHRWYGTPAPVVGTLAANRPTAHSGQLVGAHYNPLLLRTDLSDDPSLAECLLRTAAGTVSALDHQQLPYPVLAATLERTLGWPMRQVPGVAFQLDRYPMAGLRLAGCQVTGLYLDHDGDPDGAGSGTGPVRPALVPAATRAWLTFFVREAGPRLTLSVFHPEGLLAGCAVRALLRDYQDLLLALCEMPELPLSELPPAPVESGPPGVPAPDRAAGPPPGRLTLRPVTALAPAEALSPLGVWTAGPVPGR